MTTPNRLNDAPILGQLHDHYDKMLLMVLKKYVPAGAVITHEDIAALLNDEDSGNGWVLFTHGHKHSIEFKAIRKADVGRIKEHENRANRGRA